MVDIATALSGLAKAITGAAAYREVEQLDPFTISPAVTPSSITNEASMKGFKASYVSIVVRSMGTASYIDIGTPAGQEMRLKAAGAIVEISAPPLTYVDTAKIISVADVADAVIEVSGMLIPSGVLKIGSTR